MPVWAVEPPGNVFVLVEGRSVDLDFHLIRFLGKEFVDFVRPPFFVDADPIVSPGCVLDADASASILRICGFEMKDCLRYVPPCFFDGVVPFDGCLSRGCGLIRLLVCVAEVQVCSHDVKDVADTIPDCADIAVTPGGMVGHRWLFQPWDVQSGS